jgi:hypothetical protein
MKYLVVLALAAALFGCTTATQSVVFNEDDFAPYLAPGRAVIRGHAFVRTEDGRIHHASGLNVCLVPLTPYTEERARIMQAGDDPPPADPRLEKYVQTVVADNGGAFEFSNLPAGSYAVYCKITWWRRRLGASGDYYVVGRATVAAREKKHLVVTNNN